MFKRITLDPDSINVVSFVIAPKERQAEGVHLAAITRSTFGPCCEGTQCVSRSECSTSTCA